MLANTLSKAVLLLCSFPLLIGTSSSSFYSGLFGLSSSSSSSLASLRLSVGAVECGEGLSSCCPEFGWMVMERGDSGSVGFGWMC